jgi:hypothetical protein
MAFRERTVQRGGLLSLVILSMSVFPGCTSALTSAYLKGTPWSLAEPGGDDHEADATTPAAAGETTAEPSAEEMPSPEAREAARADAVERAVASLAAVGHVDAETEAALVALLQRTDQEDWPAVVDEFVAALATTAAAAAQPVAVGVIPVSIPPAVPVAVVDPPPTAPEPPGDPAADHPSAARSAEANAPATVPATAASDPPSGGAAGPLSVHNACFASRVQAWGVVERFAADHFRPGQEIIVYFELEHLEAERAPDGHTTSIDTALALVSAAGERIHDWSFEPIRETCPARRRDYFARYVVRIPATAPVGPCRLEIAVTDAVASRTAATALPLEIVAD